MRSLLLPLLVLALPGQPDAQWSPSTGQWGKQRADHVRVMTWNVQDAIRALEPKNEAVNSWTALAVVVAALQPDVLLLQETGDDGCSGCVDTVAELETVVGLFLRGGSDPFLGGTVGAYVQKYAPGFDLPFVAVSAATDGFNRNLIASRFPFTDLNGDTRTHLSNLATSFADAYAPGTISGQVIRGVQTLELDLPSLYRGDLVVLNLHLKSGSASSDLAERLSAGQNLAYHVDYWLNGAGTGLPDPNAKIFDSPPATRVLDPWTPVVLGGDWNEDELTNGRKGPVEWVRVAGVTGGLDGTDRDRGDSSADDARNACNAADRSTQSGSKLDWILHQDSIALKRLEFVFNSATIATGCAGAYPPELLLFPSSPSIVSTFASDHRPVIVDFELPLAHAPAHTAPSAAPGASVTRSL